MDEKHLSAELKAALDDMRRLTTQLVGISREWWQERRNEMNPNYRRYEQQHEGGRSERGQRGYGEGYGMSGATGREEDWEGESRYGGGRGDYGRYGRSMDWDEDFAGDGGRSYGGQYSQSRGSGRDYGGYAQQRAGGYREYAGQGGRGGYGRGFEESDFGPGSRYRESGHFAQDRGGGEYSQGYGRERDLGRAYGPEDFSQRYMQGDVFSGQSYGEGRFAQSGQQRGYGQSGRQGWQGAGRSEQGYGQYGQGERSMAQDDGQGTRMGANFRGCGPRGYKRSDERITEDLNERLTDDPQLDASDIQINVSDGIATLSGTVDARWLKHRAEDIAENCSGVKDVRNDLRVIPREPLESMTGAELETGRAKPGKATGAVAGASQTDIPGTGVTH